MKDQCAGKVSYATVRDVRGMINANQRKGIRTAYRLRYYRCPKCDKYHLTKQQ